MTASTQVNAAPVPTSSSSTPTPTQAEVVLWKSIENSNQPEDYKAYLDQYPNGAFSVLATERNQRLEAEMREDQSKIAAESVQSLSQSSWQGSYRVIKHSKKGDEV